MSGSSAGALVGGFLASGMKPSEMLKPVFDIKREDIWDVALGFGLLKGLLFQSLLEKYLPINDFSKTPIPLAVTSYDLLRFKTNIITSTTSSSDIATAIRASCCFPGLFQPVYIDSYPNIDGGIFDSAGLMGLASCFPDEESSSNLIVNIVCSRSQLSSSVLPSRFKNAMLLTLVLENFPLVTPYTMEDAGPHAYRVAR